MASCAAYMPGVALDLFPEVGPAKLSQIEKRLWVMVAWVNCIWTGYRERWAINKVRLNLKTASTMFVSLLRMLRKNDGVLCLSSD